MSLFCLFFCDFEIRFLDLFRQVFVFRCFLLSLERVLNVSVQGHRFFIVLRFVYQTLELFRQCGIFFLHLIYIVYNINVITCCSIVTRVELDRFNIQLKTFRKQDSSLKFTCLHTMLSNQQFAMHIALHFIFACQYEG